MHTKSAGVLIATHKPLRGTEHLPAVPLPLWKRGGRGDRYGTLESGFVQ